MFAVAGLVVASLGVADGLWTRSNGDYLVKGTPPMELIFTGMSAMGAAAGAKGLKKKRRDE